VSLLNSAGDERHTDTARTLKVLDAVERGDAKSQRALARDMEVALGFANAYIKRCIRKGWIKVRAAPARRYLYYVTPTGFSEKARLTAEYLAGSFNFFRTARNHCDDLIELCVRKRYGRIALIGASDLAEIAVLSGLNSTLQIVAVIDPASNQERLAGVPIVRSLADAGAVDAVMITDIRDPQQTYERLIRLMAEERVLTPTVLRVNRSRREFDLDVDEAV
jgi:DNA-binding MarR family transcriptional regulator